MKMGPIQVTELSQNFVFNWSSKKKYNSSVTDVFLGEPLRHVVLKPALKRLKKETF